MTPRTQRTIGAILAATVFTIVLPALAQTPPPVPESDGPGAGAGWWKDTRIAQQLNLSSEQRKKIDERIYQSGQRMIDLRADAEKAQLQLSRLLAADVLDEGAVEKALEQVTGAHCALERERNLARVDIARFLTKEQRLTLARFMAAKRPRPRERRR
jgi:Spy/CpxP family protein refolding chaperone